MLAPAPTPSAEPDHSGLTTEAEALCGLLLDMNLTLAVEFGRDALLVGVNDDVSPGALAVLKIVTARFNADEAFREDVISAVSHLGYYLTDAPGIDVDLGTQPGSTVVEALSKAGLSVNVATAGHRPIASFVPIVGARIAPNAHMLMDLLSRRCRDEPTFLGEVIACLPASRIA